MGPYGGTPKVFGEGPIRVYGEKERKRWFWGVEKAFMAWSKELEEGV